MSLQWQNNNAVSSAKGVAKLCSPEYDCFDARGFTIVELITTIILLSILSGVAMSTMTTSSSFAPSTITHQYNLELSLAHGYATARQDVTVSLELLADADTWLMRTSNSTDGVIRSTAVDAYNTSINVSSGATSSQLSDLDTLLLSYSGTGEIALATLAGTNIDPAEGIQFDVVGDSNRTLCLYPTGFFYHAACI